MEGHSQDHHLQEPSLRKYRDSTLLPTRGLDLFKFRRVDWTTYEEPNLSLTQGQLLSTLASPGTHAAC